jgi:hypothetical protein
MMLMQLFFGEDVRSQLENLEDHLDGVDLDNDGLVFEPVVIELFQHHISVVSNGHNLEDKMSSLFSDLRILLPAQPHKTFTDMLPGDLHLSFEHDDT